jgi:hypothetical protein
MRGILHVESYPSAPDRVDEYNRWYDEVHLPEIVAVDGVVSAKRFAPLQDDGPYVALYEIEADDLDAVFQGIAAAAGDGRIHMSDAIQMDPLPVYRLLALQSAYPAG